MRSPDGSSEMQGAVYETVPFGDVIRTFNPQRFISHQRGGSSEVTDSCLFTIQKTRKDVEFKDRS
jgi:hypothetical protein